MYKKASKLKLRVLTDQGNLSVEQLWDLSLPALDKIAVRLQLEYKESGGKSFLEVKSKKDKEIKLAFDIVLDILSSKVSIEETAAKSAETKARRQKIIALIEEKKEGAMKELSIEELERML